MRTLILAVVMLACGLAPGVGVLLLAPVLGGHGFALVVLLVMLAGAALRGRPCLR